MNRSAMVILFGLVVLSIGLFAGRRHLVVYAVASGMSADLIDAVDQGPDAEWLDDYYTLTRIDERTFAIGEPRYPQQNFSYLIVGSARALLFDAGPGVRDIRPIVRTLTDLPVTFIPSHFHYDHVGAQYTFDRVAIPDLPGLRERARDGVLELTTMEHLGFAEGFPTRSFDVDEWIEIGTTVSLGDRSVRVLFTPGHTPDSISLFDAESRLLFSGDFIYPGELFAFLPNSSMAEYAAGAKTVSEAIGEDVRVLGAHRSGSSGLPELGFSDIEELRSALEAIRMRYADGRGRYPVVYSVNDRVEILAEPRWLQRW